MQKFKKVLIRISVETNSKVRRLSYFPSKKKGKHDVSEFYGRLIEKYFQTAEFRFIEKDEEIKRLNSKVANNEFVLRIKNCEIERKSSEIERLNAKLKELVVEPKQDAA